MKNLETDRLLLRPFTLDDASVVQQLAGDYEIAKTTLHIPHPYPDGAAESWIQSLEPAAADGRMFTYAVVVKESQALIGAMGLGVQKSHNRAEIAYWVGRTYWGHGYATEAARRVVQFGFEDLKLHRVYAYAFNTNPSSTRVMEKIGMKYEGTQVQHVLKWGEYLDLIAYGMNCSIS